MFNQAQQNMKEDLDTVDGELRIALSSDLGRNLVTPWLDEFMETYPDVRVTSHISDSNIDFYRDSVDMALRYGSPDEANLYGFKICNVPGVLCATPEYLDNNGTPEHPHSLVSHNGLFYQLHDILHDVVVMHQKVKRLSLKSMPNGSQRIRSHRLAIEESEMDI